MKSAPSTSQQKLHLLLIGPCPLCDPSVPLLLAQVYHLTCRGSYMPRLKSG